MRRTAASILAIILGAVLTVLTPVLPAQAADHLCGTVSGFTLRTESRFKSTGGKVLGSNSRICLYTSKTDKNTWVISAYAPAPRSISYREVWYHNGKKAQNPGWLSTHLWVFYSNYYVQKGWHGTNQLKVTVDGTVYYGPTTSLYRR